jgi:hypothetical protein
MPRSVFHESGADKRLSFLTEKDVAAVTAVRGQPVEVVGPQGPSGNPGAVGEKGPSGNPGLIGLKGPVGDKGIIGIQGTDGKPGIVGLKGPVGDKGPIGIQGAAGSPGTVGLKGPVGDKGPIGLKGPIGDQGEAGDMGPEGQSWVPLFGNPGGIVPLGDAGVVGYEYLPPEFNVSAAPTGTGTEIKSAAISLTASFSGSSTKVPYSNLLHDEGSFFNAASPGVLKVPANYGGKAWVQPSYYFESNSSTGQRVASLVQVVGGVETVLNGYRNLLLANGLKGVSFRGAWLLVDAGTEFYIAYSNGTSAQAMGIGAWFQIEVRKGF